MQSGLTPSSWQPAIYIADSVNLINEAGYLPLATDWDRRKPSDWSVTHDYMLDSTLYLFGRYFACVHLLRTELGADAFPPNTEKDELFQAVRGSPGPRVRIQLFLTTRVAPVLMLSFSAGSSRHWPRFLLTGVN